MKQENGIQLTGDLRHLRKLLLSKHAALLIESFEERRHVLTSRLKKARRQPTEKAVHGLRVAARRMLSMLAVLETRLPRKTTRGTRRIVKKGLRDLGEMRDVQVQMAHTGSMLPDFPQLAPFVKFLGGKERRLEHRVTRELDSWSPRKLRRKTDRVLAQLLGSLDPNADAALGEQISMALEDAYGRVLTLRARIDPRQTATIHRTRVTFKRFRYMAETVAPGFSQLDSSRLKAMRDYQDRMGAIQDMEALLQAMMEFRRRSGRTSILVVENEIRRRRSRLIDDFMQTVDEVRFFWSAPQAESREVV